MENKICYVVSEYGGDWEDSWEAILAVFLDKNLAEKYVSSRELPEESLKISLEEYNLLSEEIQWEKLTEAEKTLTIPELILKIHPDLDLRELKRTEEFQRREDWDYYGTKIEETVLICQ